MENRRNFLKTACKPLVLATLGIPILEACSPEETNEGPGSTGPSGSSSSSSPTEPLVLDIGSSLFADLQAVGGWQNYTASNILLVRISDSEIRAFDNSCPHQGNRDRWSYDGNNFTCGYHNNSFSNSCSGSLTCYTTKLEDTILTITF